MRNRLDHPGALLLAAALAIPATALTATAQEEAPGGPPPDIEWIMGPADGPLGDQATLPIPEGYVFAGAEDTRKLMEAFQNLTNGTELGFVSPVDGGWFVVFEFQDIGYVKDDEGASLDGDAILASLREGNAQSNEVRESRGWPTMEIDGWAQPPHYDPETNNLEWGMSVSSVDGTSVNYNTRLLGRDGVMSATLVVDPDKLESTLPAFKSLIGGHSFTAGHRYAEYRAGDRIAQYGLTALITGGAVAAAIKTGLLQKFWKLIVVAGAGAVAVLKKIFIRSEKAPPAPVA